MKEAVYKIGRLPALLCGDEAERVYLFVHGKHGCKEEARDFAETACSRGWQVLAVDLPEHGARRGEAGAFAARFHCDLTVMEAGEHWFHTEEQLAFLRQWTERQTEEVS